MGRPGRARPHALQPHAWYLAWWDGYGADRELRVCTVWDGAELVALLPLCGRAGRLEAMANEESCVVRPLARDAEALQLLAEAAASERYDLMEIRRLPEGDEGIEALAAAARAAGRLSIVEPDITSPIVDTTGTLDEYRQATRGKWHKNLRRLYRKLLRDHDARLSLIEAPGDLESELAEGFEVESSGWKRAAGSAILSRPENEAYYRSLGRRFHDRGELRLSSISVDGRMIAWDLGILRATGSTARRAATWRSSSSSGRAWCSSWRRSSAASSSASRRTSCWAQTMSTSCGSPPASAATGTSVPIRGGPCRPCATRGGASFPRAPAPGGALAAGSSATGRARRP